MRCESEAPYLPCIYLWKTRYNGGGIHFNRVPSRINYFSDRDDKDKLPKLYLQYIGRMHTKDDFFVLLAALVSLYTYCLECFAIVSELDRSR